MDATSHCPRCNTEVGPRARFCPTCGRRLGAFARLGDDPELAGQLDTRWIGTGLLAVAVFIGIGLYLYGTYGLSHASGESKTSFAGFAFISSVVIVVLAAIGGVLAVRSGGGAWAVGHILGLILAMLLAVVAVMLSMLMFVVGACQTCSEGFNPPR